MLTDRGIGEENLCNCLDILSQIADVYATLSLHLVSERAKSLDTQPLNPGTYITLSVWSYSWWREETVTRDIEPGSASRPFRCTRCQEIQV